MRDGSTTFPALIGSLCLALGASMGACSDDVVDNNPAGGGQGGTGGGTTTTITTTSTTSTTSTDTSSGVPTICDDACQYAAHCGLDVCGSQELDCAKTEDECAAQCIHDATCAQILTLPTQNPDLPLSACVFGCQDGGPGTPGYCGVCLSSSGCLDPIQNCNDPDCQAWGQCALGCVQNDPQPTCIDACDAQHPAAAPAYTMVDDCACMYCDCESMMGACSQNGGTGGAGGAGGSGSGGAGGVP